MAQSTAHDPFLVVPYRCDSDGWIKAHLPTQCPHRQPDDPPCMVIRKGHRVRKTGPGFRFCIFRCRRHNKKFTAYPPGYAPFLRKPLVSLAVNGLGLSRDEPGSVLSNTIFQAALDAAQGKTWPKGVVTPTEQCFMTQTRRLRRIARLLGISPHMGTRERERVVVGCLEIPVLAAHEAHQSLEKNHGYQSLGRNMRRVLCELASGFRVYERMLESGYLNGFWGRPHVLSTFAFVDRLERLGKPGMESRAGPGIVTYSRQASKTGR